MESFYLAFPAKEDGWLILLSYHEHGTLVLSNDYNLVQPALKHAGQEALET
jgi:hypothetical protein